ncbi:MAG: FGGY-family carbohydrate kinase [Chloroflexaceae bacterium]|jgi:xylulokinase|nr:FGGY-family carbohydrate kinase [Chloroflexaceae bacterium]
MAQHKDLVLAVDSSTTATKAIVWDKNGHAVAEGRATFPLLNPHPGWYEQRADEWWTATAQALRDATAQIDARRLAAICMTHQRETFVPVDEQCNPIRDAILWLDERSRAQVAAMEGRFGNQRLHQITGKPVAMTPSLYKILWLQEHEPEVLRRAHKIVDVHAFLVYKLTSQWKTSWSCADPMGMVDMRTWQWSSEVMEGLGLNPEHYPELAAPGAVMGEVTAEAARLTGLPVGLPVVASAGDGQSAGLGANITRAGKAYLNLGTAVVSGAHSEKYAADINFRTLGSPIAGAYTLETLIRGGTFTVSWFVNRFAHDLKHVALPLSVEELLEAGARKVLPGSLGLMLVPYWNGVTNPYWDGNATGMIVGWTGSHGREHMYRALLEGIAYEQRLGTEGVEKALGQPIDEYVVLGGGSKSPLWCQIIADVTGKRVTRSANPEATCLGSGILAAVAAGWYRDAQEAAAAMTNMGASYEPDPATQTVYNQLYTEVYTGLFPAMQTSLSRLTELTHGS